MRQHRTRDRRVRRSETLLRNALATLIHEQPYDKIKVTQILDRANVGRSTFYTHFSGKDELLLDCVAHVLRSGRDNGAGPCRDRVWFSLPLLEHIESHRRGAQAKIERPALRCLHEHLQHAIVELIEGEVGNNLQRRGPVSGRIPPGILARWIASTFVLVLNGWVETGHPPTAREADRLFRSLVEPALARHIG